MALNIQLQQDPNQNFELLIEKDLYSITIRTFGEISYVSIIRNGEILIQNIKAIANKAILPYEYLYLDHGNFRFFSSINSEYPYYKNFNTTTFFEYLTKEEVASAV